jgi:hypothetical protein
MILRTIQQVKIARNAPAALKTLLKAGRSWGIVWFAKTAVTKRLYPGNQTPADHCPDVLSSKMGASCDHHRCGKKRDQLTGQNMMRWTVNIAKLERKP